MAISLIVVATIDSIDSPFWLFQLDTCQVTFHVLCYIHKFLEKYQVEHGFVQIILDSTIL